MKFIFIYITAKDNEQARFIGKTLLNEHLAACINIIDGMQSMYWWDGKINENSETILIVKTRESLFEKIVTRVKVLHTYSCPCIIALPITQGSDHYLKWLQAETEQQQ
jgi:periplasmic divalent cation tolerance protein